MYDSFYKLHPTPFRLTPDPHFFFESETHKRGLAYLRFAFYQGEGFVAITGAPGTGKTELALNLIEELPQQKISLAKIVSTNLDADDFLDMVASSFQINIENISKGSELKKLEDYFISQAKIGKQVLLLIDEAHNLSVKSLLELSMLENFQLDGKPVMQCFLLGQPPLEETLNLPELEPLKQRVIASARLDSLSQFETRDYIIHRLRKSGWNNNPIIHDEAYFFIYHYTNGIPRKINSLCNRLLLHSYVESRHEIGPNTVNKVAQEFQEEAIGTSMDLDFAELQATVESSSKSKRDEDRNSDYVEEIAAENTERQVAKTLRDESNDKVQDKQYGSSDQINIPAFIRKTGDQGSSSQLRMLNKSHQVTAHQPQRKEVELAGSMQYSSTQDSATGHANVNVATARKVTHEHVNRPSGLLDKDLQFLSSIADSIPPIATTRDQQFTANTAIEKTSQPIVEKMPEQETVPVSEDLVEEIAKDEEELAEQNQRTVIIDESVYSDEEINDSNYEMDWQPPKTSLLKSIGWRETFISVVVVVSLILSINWLYEGNSVPTEIVAENQSANNSTSENLIAAEVFTDSTPVDVELPIVRSTDTNAETSSNSESEISDIENPVNIASAIDTTSLTKTESASDSSESAVLDNEITQILEKSGPESSDTENVADEGNIPFSESDKPVKLATRSTEKQDSAERSKPVPNKTIADKPLPAKVNTKKQSNNSLVIKSDLPPVARSTSSTSKAIDSKQIAVQENKPDSFGIEATPRQTNKQAAAGSGSTSQQVATMTTSVSSLNSNRDSMNQRSEPLISSAALVTLLSRLSDAYQNGNLKQLVSTFALDIESSDGSDRRQMLNQYQHLFTITDQRKLTIQDVKWTTKDSQILGKGDFEVLIREKGATKPTTYQGKISFTVARELDSVVIKKLDYDYGQ